MLFTLDFYECIINIKTTKKLHLLIWTGVVTVFGRYSTSKYLLAADNRII